MRNLRRVAAALDRSLLDVLIAAEYIHDSEIDPANRPAPREPVDARSAIVRDPKLSPVTKEICLQVIDAVPAVESGTMRTARISSARPRKVVPVKPAVPTKSTKTPGRRRTG